MQNQILNNHALTSPEQSVVARALSNVLIAIVAGDDSLGGAHGADMLARARDAVWSPGAQDLSSWHAEKEQRVAAFEQILAQLPSPEQQEQFLEAYARMGHLYELAALIARENIIHFDLVGKSPGGARELIERCATVGQAVASLNKPVFEVVMTAHPTNVNSLYSMEAQRVLGQAIDGLRLGRDGAEREFLESLEEYVRAPLVQQKDGVLQNFTVNDETDIALYHLSNIYRDLPEIYAAFDQEIVAKGQYDPTALDLQLRLSSWGSSGDKDGNDKVNADTTLYAIASHRLAIIELYAQDLSELPYPELESWRRNIQSKLVTIKERQSAIVRPPQMHGWGGYPIAMNFRTSYGAELGRLKLDIKEFEETVRALYEQTEDARVLNLLRNIRIFGNSLGKIEYRENTSEFGRVVEALVPEYKNKSPEEKEAFLTDLINDPVEVRKCISHKKDALEAAGRERGNGVRTNPLALAYHTLKRMEYARDNGDMIQNIVLAECEHPHQILEALFLQRAASDGTHATLSITPLFESPESMRAAPAIMEAVYSNPVYRAHMDNIQALRDTDGVVQEIQIAHSDNARRSGMPAARGFIYDAHQTLREVSKKHGIDLHFFEGGSASDVYRGGVRSTSAAIRNYGLQDFAKFTFQGGDMLNYMNYMPSTKRLFMRSFVQAASFHAAGRKEEAVPETWKTRTDSRASKRVYHAGEPEDTSALDAVVATALEATLPDYQAHAFTAEGLGRFLNEIGYEEEKRAGTAGSRTPARPGSAPAAQGALFEEPKEAVDIQKTRTITFSESMQHAGLVPTMIGARTLEQNLQQELNDMRQRCAAKAAAGEKPSSAELGVSKLYHARAGASAHMPPRVVEHIFNHSKLFRDVIVRMALGVGLSDFDRLKQHYPGLEDDPFVRQLEEEYRVSARLCIEAVTGQSPEELLGQKTSKTNFAAIPTDDLRYLLISQFPEVSQIVQDKTRYLDLLQTMKQHLPALASDDREGAHRQAYLRRLLHVAGDTVTHGRIVPVDDPAIGVYIRDKMMDSLNVSGACSAVSGVAR